MADNMVDNMETVWIWYYIYIHYGYNPWDLTRIRINGGTLVPYCWPYFVGISPLKFRPKMYGRYLQSIGSWASHCKDARRGDFETEILSQAALKLQITENILKPPQLYLKDLHWASIPGRCSADAQMKLKRPRQVAPHPNCVHDKWRYILD